MKFVLQINQKEIIESGIKGLKIHEWLLFDVVRHMIGADWTKKIVDDEKSYAWISEQGILSQVPLLELSKRQVHRLIDNLVEAGLLVRFHGNIALKRSYLGLTPLGDSIGRHSMTEMSGLPDSARQKRQAEPDKNDRLSLTEMSGYNTNSYKSINDTLIPPTPFVEFPTESSTAPSQGLEKVTVAPKVKKRITFREAKEFYDMQLKELFPLPPEVAPGGGEWNRREGYKRMIDWMINGDDETPETMQSTVMAMPSQLTYAQLCKLMDQRNLTWYQIKHYMKRLHGYTELKSRGIYDTIVNWHNGDVARNAVPPAKPIHNATGGVHVDGLVARTTRNEEYTR